MTHRAKPFFHPYGKTLLPEKVFQDLSGHLLFPGNLHPRELPETSQNFPLGAAAKQIVSTNILQHPDDYDSPHGSLFFLLPRA